MNDEIIIRIPEPKPLPANVTRCPRCGGTGLNADGMLCVSTTEIRIRPQSKCGTCLGSGMVRVSAYTPEDEADEG